jgi:transcriptional regulator with XRE-family HTH domain
MDALAVWADAQKLAGETQQAERIGIDRATLNRVRRGVMAPGEQFIAAVLTATGGKFEEFFEIAEAS